MIKNDEMINVYNDYDSNIYAPSVEVKGIDLMFPKKDEYNEPYVVSIPFSEVKNLHRLDKNVFTKRILRFEDREDEIFKALNIRLDREKDVYSREEIEEMILNPTDEIIQIILKIKDRGVIERFLAQLVYLKNTNKYFIPSKIEFYIRARKEELDEGLKESDLEGQPTENVPVIDEVVETGVEEEKVSDTQVEKAKPKARSTSKSKTK